MAENKKPLTVTLQVKELLYDIMNKAYLTGEARKAASKDQNYEEASNMQASEDTENSYQLRRSLANAYSSLKSLLGEYLDEDRTTSDNLIQKEIDDDGVALGQLAQNLNCDFNQLQQGVSAVQSAIQQVAGQVGFSAERVINAANLGDLNIVQQLKDCCCQTQQSILNMGYQNQLGQKDIINGMEKQTLGFERSLDFVNRSVERGFSALGYQNAQDKCDIINEGKNNTQRIIDTLNNHWSSDLLQRYNDARLELSQQRQNAALIAALRTTTTTTATT